VGGTRVDPGIKKKGAPKRALTPDPPQGVPV
jgi:hypothetical protein